MICKICHGRGTFRQRLGLGLLPNSVQCWRCKGTGHTTPCDRCKGAGCYEPVEYTPGGATVETCEACAGLGVLSVPAEEPTQ